MIVEGEETPKSFLLLIAEEDQTQAELISLACVKLGLASSEFRIFRDGTKLVDYLEMTIAWNPNQRATAIVSDFQMPFMNGLQVLAWVRMNMVYKDLPVYLWTAETLTAIKEKARKLGCTALLPKFSSFSELHNLLKLVIDQVNRM